MKKRWTAAALVLALVLALWVPGVQAAGGRVPIYLGDMEVDYMAEEILGELPTAGKSAKEQIALVYDWIIDNFHREGTAETAYFTDAELSEANNGAFGQAKREARNRGELVLRPDFETVSTVLPGGMMVFSVDSFLYLRTVAREIMMGRVGTCAHYAAALAVLLGHLGFDCRVIEGSFLSNGQWVEHKWNYVLLDGQYYWLDVRMDQSFSASGAGSRNFFLVADTDQWAERHQWDHGYSDWLSANAAEIEAQYQAEIAEAAGPWSRCSDWAKPYLEKADAAGLIPDTMAGADFTAGITRAEFAAVAVRLYQALGGKMPAAGGASPFSDTQDADVLAAFALGIVQGVGGGRYAPSSTLTRAQAVTMLGRVYELLATGAVGDGSSLPAESEPFVDDGDIAAWAKHYVYFFVANGVVDGMGGNRFAPNGTMTREQALKVAALAVETLGSTL